MNMMRIIMMSFISDFFMVWSLPSNLFYSLILICETTLSCFFSSWFPICYFDLALLLHIKTRGLSWLLVELNWNIFGPCIRSLLEHKSVTTYCSHTLISLFNCDCTGLFVAGSVSSIEHFSFSQVNIFILFLHDLEILLIVFEIFGYERDR